VSLDHHEECNSSVVHSIQQSYRSMADNLEHEIVGRDKMDEWEILETEMGMVTDLDTIQQHLHYIRSSVEPRASWAEEQVKYCCISVDQELQVLQGLRE